MHYDILDKQRLEILPLLRSFKSDFYLAGGTALALQIGHRDSIDFDFFCREDIDTKKLFKSVEKVFSGHKIKKTQEENNTLGVFIDEIIRLSFMTFPYKLSGKLINEPDLALASIADIGAMKLSAITGRAANKDYIDLYFILHTIKLDKLLENTAKKFPSLDIGLVLKSLVYFDDIDFQPIKFKKGNKVDFGAVKDFLIEQVKAVES